jgi:hypothetical protein
MANTVFILGAGASYQAGVPLMNDFLDVAYNLWRTGEAKDFDQQFASVFRGRSALQQVHSKSQLNIQNIESVFAAFEMGKTLQKFSDFTNEEIDNLVAAMKSIIVATIESKLEFPVSSSNGISSPYPYDSFVDMLANLRTKTVPKQDVAIITFNYDLALDYAFYRQQARIYYGLENNKRENDISLLKLHGSLNWAQCSVCSKVIPWELSQYYSTRQPRFRQNIYRLRLGSKIGEYKHGDHDVNREPLIAPPTWSKSEYYKILSPVWGNAAKELTDAENIFVIGYSLPESDSFFRYLYALGTVGTKLLKRFWVFDPDETGNVEKRFRELLGHGALQAFKPFRLTFEKAIGEIAKTFGVSDTSVLFSF